MSGRDQLGTSLDTAPLSVVIMTFNEELNVERCLTSVHGWADEIFVVDSFSTDGTLDIVHRYTEKVYQHAYESHPQQWQWALDNLPFQYEWILALDADFIVTPELRRAVSEVVLRNDPAIDGYYVRHRQVFRGRFIRHGTIYPRYWLRLFRHDKVFVDEHDLVDLHFYVDGQVSRLEYDLIEDNQKERELAFWVQKQVRFAQRQAVAELRRRQGIQADPMRPTPFGTPDQRTLWLKGVWSRLPLYLRPFLYFFYRYVVRLGFLDGKEGFLYHFSQAFLYRLMVDVRIEELHQEALDSKALLQKAPALGPKADRV